uniref:Uncharacterized protein n=1 Tax=Anopheles merus TaxID=30066 RepID=A0A182VN13_ANOME
MLFSSSSCAELLRPSTTYPTFESSPGPSTPGASVWTTAAGCCCTPNDCRASSSPAPCPWLCFGTNFPIALWIELPASSPSTVGAFSWSYGILSSSLNTSRTGAVDGSVLAAGSAVVVVVVVGLVGVVVGAAAVVVGSAGRAE